VGVGYPYLADELDDYSYVPFVAFLILFYFLSLKLVPETSGKTIEEIQLEYAERHDGTSLHSPLATFGPGSGPCGPDASQVVTVVYKLRIRGRGLVALEWEAGVETEERLPCFIVAERHILKKTLERQPRLFTFPHSLTVEVAFEEPLRLPDSDQLRFLPPKVVTTRDLHTASPTKRLRDEVEPSQSGRGKRTLRKATVTSPAYRYSPLAELVPGFADIYGVVVNVKLPKKTGGRDYCMTVSVTDESCPTRSEAIQINIFYSTIAQMPKIKVYQHPGNEWLYQSLETLQFPTNLVRLSCDQFVGDILRLHKVKIQQYQDKIQGVSFDWSKKSLAEDITLPQGCPMAPPLLAELKFAEGFVDIVVRVLHLDDSEEPVRLIVWDGSGHAAASDRNLVLTLQHSGIAVPTDGVLKELIMGSCWSVVRDMGFAPGMRTQWCRFRNLAVATDEPLPGAAAPPIEKEVLRFREVTSLVLVPEFMIDVQQRLTLRTQTNQAVSGEAASAEGEQSRVLPRPVHTVATARPVKVASVIPNHIRNNVPVTPLRDVLSSAQTPRKFHCRAHVRGIWPTDVAKVCKLKPGSDGEYIYSFVLTLEDANDALDVILYGKDAEHLLHGIPPCDLSKSTSSKTLLEKRFAALLATPDVLHCCVKSYTVALPPSGAAGMAAAGGPNNRAIRYRLFDTLLQWV
ncbi:hypothetical protein BBJ28_00011019, partial [Nothophytophthora sp. Chile5]